MCCSPHPIFQQSLTAGRAGFSKPGAAEERSLQAGAFPSSCCPRPLPAQPPAWGSTTNFGGSGSPRAPPEHPPCSTGSQRADGLARSCDSNPQLPIRGCPPVWTMAQARPRDGLCSGGDDDDDDKEQTERIKDMQEHTANKCVQMMLNTSLFSMVTRTLYRAEKNF